MKKITRMELLKKPHAWVMGQAEIMIVLDPNPYGEHRGVYREELEYPNSYQCPLEHFCEIEDWRWEYYGESGRFPGYGWYEIFHPKGVTTVYIEHGRDLED